MKILYDHQIFSNQKFGGISRYFYELMNHSNGLFDYEVSGVFSENEYIKPLRVYREFPIKYHFKGKHIILSYLNKPDSIQRIKKEFIKMIDKLKKYIKKHDKLKNFILRKRSDLWSLSHLQIVSKLKKCHLDNLKLLSFDIPYLITCESHRTNDYYGQAATLKRYCGIDNKNSLKCVITHGADLFDHITDCDADSKLPGIITMSKGARKEIYTRANNKKHWAIGPYISYAESFLSEDKLKQEHERLGKNILFFPNHSTHHFTVNFNVEAVCKTIKQLAGNYDRIRVCLYWKDVQLGYYKTYQNFGFECVSAGHIYDNNFLRRLKSIIELSDVTVSNSVGTSLGYSIYMNKPHYLIKQKYDYEADHIAKENIEKQKLLENKLEMFYDIFGEFKETISLEQYEIVDRYWGTSCIKTKDGLKKIFDECERIYSHKEK